jgi:hypothetical protein
MTHPLTDVTFESFNLHPSLLSGLHASGFTRCTPIQALTLPIALTGRDVAGQAQTGTGKTGAFLVAVLNRLLTQPARADRKLSDPRAIIIAPTRELAIQIDKDFKNIGRDTGLRSALIYGGVDYDKQRETLKNGSDLIIATPGRLIDYLKQHVFSFNSIEAVVLDEADRMFDLGFIKDIRFLFRRMPPREERQGMLFSATLSHRVLELAYDHMNEPEKLAVEADNVTADRVRQVVYFPAKEEKQPCCSTCCRSWKRIAASSSSTPRSPPKKSRARSNARASASPRCPATCRRPSANACSENSSAARSKSSSRPTSPRAACTFRGQPRLQLRPAAGCGGLRAPRRPHRTPGRRRRRDQLRLRPLRDDAARHRGLHRAEDPDRADHRRPARNAAAARARERARE